jgi:hypothetical protein
MLRDTIEDTRFEADPPPAWARESQRLQQRREARQESRTEVARQRQQEVAPETLLATRPQRPPELRLQRPPEPPADWRAVDRALRSIRDNRAALEPQSDWRTVDGALRAIRTSRAALDAEEMYWLREAEALQIWRPLGMVSAIDYLERRLGYAPRTAQDRLRVARALGTLPQLTNALGDGKLPFTAVRELTRVVTAATEGTWITAATGKNLRQIEELVADHRQGDNPDDPPDPEARTHVVRFDLAAETFALLRQARTVINDEHGQNLADDAFIAALCAAALDDSPTTEPTGRAKFQVALTVCRRCQQGWQEGAGVQIAVDDAAVERARCDAQHIGSIDGSGPDRTYQDIPPSVVRFVWRRDGGRCRVDGCRSSRGLELHHVIHRADGGTHDASNIVLCCSSCHQAHHAGLLAISGTAAHLVVRRPGDAAATATAHDLPAARATPINPITANRSRHARAHVGAADQAARNQADRSDGTTDPPNPMTPTIADQPRETRAHVRAANQAARNRTDRTDGTANPANPMTPMIADQSRDARLHAVSIASACGDVKASSRLDAAILRTQAKAALTSLGWKPAIAHTAVAAAAAAHGSELTLERLIFESLRRCPAPRT